MNYTDDQLKQALAKMLLKLIPLKETQNEALDYYCYVLWKKSNPHDMEVRDTKLLHLCWLVEGTLSYHECNVFELSCRNTLSLEIFSNTPVVKRLWHASWKQRVEALAKVKGVEIN
jgi:hypothetical protein